MKKRYLNWILVLIWMFIIFIFSSQTGESSNQNNRLVVQILEYIGLDITGHIGDATNFIIRKAAHFTEYLILYLLLYKAFAESRGKKKSLWISLLCVFAYACTDEFHQAFVPQRVPSFRDVMIDTGGGILGMIIKCWSNIRRKYR